MPVFLGVLRLPRFEGVTQRKLDGTKERIFRTKLIIMAPECIHCKKSPPEVKLRNCAKCSSALYCSRDCQKADWKAHKKICGKNRDGPTTTTKGLETVIDNPFTRLENRTWLHDRSEKDVYGLLIDAYRLRVEDMYSFEGEADMDSIYGGAPNGLRGFRRFLQRVEKSSGLMPPWWDADKKKECEALGMSSSQWHDLQCAVEKSDIVDHYGNPQFPMQLRMFAELVYGRAPGGTSGTAMRQLLMAMENGTNGGTYSHLDVSAGPGRQ
ncbi:hypothetical protein XA68_17291 [Ophiocordyceps unilateralis]|uniref:MYND-type domain-containing protein n=1 Tax=Ophiocordyceps unilateralis TaxID=268505 RepID=A0A2A9PKQ4_OPHUN|nr:hypothetical protein XA68_17291 [Ophiocordyceps unilateralis]